MNIRFHNYIKCINNCFLDLSRSLDKKTIESFQNFLFNCVKKLNIPCIIVSHRIIKNLKNSFEINIANSHKK